MAAVILAMTLLQAVAPRSTVVAKASDPPLRNYRILYYDDAFLFAARDYGSARDVEGNTTPGLFVHSKEKGRWMEIGAISTADGRFGTSQSNDPEEQKKLSMSQVGWDFREYARREYIGQPLQTGGSIVFPDRITYESGTARYELRYMSSWGIPSAETVLYIRRADLIEAFARR
jgi:hypothetical protein